MSRPNAANLLTTVEQLSIATSDNLQKRFYEQLRALIKDYSVLEDKVAKLEEWVRTHPVRQSLISR